MVLCQCVNVKKNIVQNIFTITTAHLTTEIKIKYFYKNNF